MITSVAEFLEALLAREVEILGRENVTHAPTIGEMYEGLTQDVLNRVIPENLDVRVVHGFVEGHDGQLGPEADAMLVTGEGKPVPYTDKFKWPIKDVLAIFEIKKNLWRKELLDSLQKLKQVHDITLAAANAGNIGPISLAPTFQAFAKLTGKLTQNGDFYRTDDPSYSILRVMGFDQYAPVRIVYGFGGFSRERTLRSKFMELIEQEKLAPAAFPNLVICKSFYVIKMTGHPYLSDIHDKWWPVLGSERQQPWRAIIELIWTRLGYQFGAAFPMDDSLVTENLAGLLICRPVDNDGARGWEYDPAPGNLPLPKPNSGDIWQPAEISIDEMTMISICGGRISLDDPEWIDYARDEHLNLPEILAHLVSTRIFAWDGDRAVRQIRPDILTMATSDQRYWAADNFDLLSMWVEKRNAELGRQT